MVDYTQIYSEYAKILQDDIYAIETMLKVYDITQGGFVPYKLFPRQKDIVKAFNENRHNIVAKPRQAGISTTTQAYLAVKCALASKEKPEVILVIANKLSLAIKFAKGIKDFINQMPRWVFGSEYYGSKEREKKDIFESNSKQEMTLDSNGSKIVAVATSPDALRGYSPTYLVFDEAAFIDNNAEETYSAAMASLSTGGKCILISTPNGQDPVYYETYANSIQNAKDKDNGFNSIEMRWYQDPRYNKDLQWLNKDGSVNHDEDVFCPYDSSEEERHRILEYYEDKVRNGLKPTSSWYRGMCANLQYNKKKIAQELDVSFLGSGGNVIDDEFIIMQEKQNVMDPKFVDQEWFDGEDNLVWVWDLPVEGHQYILSADVASGTGKDKSAFSVIDFTTMEQVAEFKGNIPPDIYAQVIYKYAIEYNAYVVVDNIGYGASTALKLKEMNCPNLHYDDYTPKALISDKKANEIVDVESKIPGFNVSGVRLQLVSNLEEKVRLNQIKVKSRRVTTEMRTFIYKANGRPDHAEGKNDDCLMALAIGLFVMEYSFKRLEKSQGQRKMILTAWVNTGTAVTMDKETKERIDQKYFNPFIYNFNPQKNMSEQQKRSYGDQTDYSWLYK